MVTVPESRNFRVHARHVDRHHGRLISEPSFEAAAVAYVEDFAAPATDEELVVIVHDVDSGHEHCFKVNMETGETEPCG